MYFPLMSIVRLYPNLDISKTNILHLYANFIKFTSEFGDVAIWGGNVHVNLFSIIVQLLRMGIPWIVYKTA